MSGRSRSDELRQLQGGLLELNLDLGQEALGALLTHLELVRQWAGSYNLVSRGDLGALVSRHLLDSLAIHAWVPDGSLLDVGSGAGFPGLPLAIARPALEVTLLDSSGKRARFLRHVARTLRLSNVRVVYERVEDYAPGERFNTIISRAFASLPLYAERVRHLADADTRVLAIKGRHPGDELDCLPAWVSVRAVEPYRVPDLHAERHLVIMSLSPESG